jgi:exopolysaccharide biosynthesis operon protein EpsL
MRSSESGFYSPATGTSGSRLGRAALAALALAAPSPAWSFFNDRVELWFNETMMRDSNVFRLSRNVDLERTVGTSDLSDRILTHTVGITAGIPVSLQRFEASYAHFWTRYNRFDQLDFDGDVARAAWLWAVTREFNGELSYTHTTGLASFAAFRGTTKDVITTRQLVANANWQLNARWIAYGGLTATEREHDQPERRLNDLEAQSLEARMSYITPKENRIGVSLRAERGGAPESRPFLGVDFDNGYRQLGVGVVGRWEVTPVSRFDGRFDYVKREYDQFSQRDYSGPAWGITYAWTPSPKFNLLATVRRDIAPLEEVQTTFVLATGAGVKPRWQLTEKFALVGSADYMKWKYKGDPLVGGDFEHTVRSGSFGFAWTPLQRVLITGGVQREVRTSDLANADYKTTIHTLDARIGF